MTRTHNDTLQVGKDLSFIRNLYIAAIELSTSPVLTHSALLILPQNASSFIQSETNLSHSTIMQLYVLIDSQATLTSQPTHCLRPKTAIKTC